VPSPLFSHDISWTRFGECPISAVTTIAAGEPDQIVVVPKTTANSLNNEKERVGQAMCRSTFPAVPRNLELVGLPVRDDGVHGRVTLRCFERLAIAMSGSSFPHAIVLPA
jgi:hypothetical protein